MTHELWRDLRGSAYGHGSDGGGGGWPGLRQLVFLRTTRTPLDTAKPAVVEDHFYLTSLSPTAPRGDAQACLGHARRHWEIENCLHHVKDRSLGEDAQRCRHGAGLFSRLRSLAVGLLAHVEGTSTPLKLLRLAARPAEALRLLRRRRFPKKVGNCYL